MSPASPPPAAEQKPLPEPSGPPPAYVSKPLSALPPPPAALATPAASQYYPSPFQYPSSNLSQTLPFIAYKPPFAGQGFGPDPFAYAPMAAPLPPQPQPGQFPLQVLPIPPLMDGSRPRFVAYQPPRVASRSPPADADDKAHPALAPTNHLLRPTYMYGDAGDEHKCASEANTHGKVLLSAASRPKDAAPPPPAYKSRPYVCGHDGCSWSFSRQSDLRRHAKTHKKPTFECPYWKHDNSCHRNGGSFSRLDVLKRHLRLVHFIKDKQAALADADPGWCKACQKMFPSSKSFIAHCVDCAGDKP